MGSLSVYFAPLLPAERGVFTSRRRASACFTRKTLGPNFWVSSREPYSPRTRSRSDSSSKWETSSFRTPFCLLWDVLLGGDRWVHCSQSTSSEDIVFLWAFYFFRLCVVGKWVVRPISVAEHGLQFKLHLFIINRG